MIANRFGFATKTKISIIFAILKLYINKQNIFCDYLFISCWLVALRPPPVAEKGSNALSEITSNRKHIYVQRIATIFQTGERSSPLHCIVEKVTILRSGIICVKSHRFYNRYDWRSLTAATDYTQFSSKRASDERPYWLTITFIQKTDWQIISLFF